MGSVFFFLVIDDGTPLGHLDAASQVSSEHYAKIDVSVVRIDQNYPWNIGGARNLLFAVAPTDNVLLMDMDVALSLEFANTLPKLLAFQSSLEKETQKHVIINDFERDKPRGSIHPAIMLLRTSAYWVAGGCDEDLVGSYGGTDPHFKWRAEMTKGVLVHSISSKFLDFEVPPVEMVRGGYKCKPPLRNSTRNKCMVIAKKKGELPWSEEYLRFTWRELRRPGTVWSGTGMQ